MGSEEEDRQRLGDFRFGRDRERADRGREPASRPAQPTRRPAAPGRGAPATARRPAQRRPRPAPSGARSGRGFLVGLGAAGLLIGGITLYALSRLIAPPAPPATEEANATAPSVVQGEPSATTPPSWVVTFEYHFPLGFWTPGMHSYSLEAYCPGLAGASGAWRSTVLVSEDAPLRPERVFLRAGGVRDASIGGLAVAAIHPSQTSGAAFSLVYPTLEEVERGSRDCSVTVSVDGGAPVELQPRIPYQR